MSDFLVIDMNTLDDGGFQFCQTVLIRKVLESTGMEHCNRLPTLTKVDAPLGTDANGFEAKRDWPNSYASVIWMILYLASNTIPDISFSVHQCAKFTHKTKALHEIAVKMIIRYLQGIKDNGLVFNPSKKMVVDFYADVIFAGLWGHENPRYHICARSRTGFVVKFSNFPYYGCQKYRHRFLVLQYILSMWYCLILLEHYYPLKVLSRK